MLTILLIDDNKKNIDITLKFLKFENFNILIANNLKSGITKAIELLPDIILSNSVIANENDFEVLKALNSDKRVNEIPFIFLSEKNSHSDIRNGMNMGADDYLSIPYLKKDLINSINARLIKINSFKKKLESINNFVKNASEFLDIEGFTDKYLLKLYQKNDELYMEGNKANNLFFIKSGRVKTYKTSSSGKLFVTGIYGPGDFIGQISLFNNKGMYIETASVDLNTLACGIPKTDFKKLLYSNKIVALKFIEFMAYNLIETKDLLTNMAYNTVRQRAAKALLDISVKGLIGTKSKAEIHISRDDFAGMIGSAPETAIRILSEFKHENLIQINCNRNLILLDPNKIRKVAQFG